MRRSFLILLVFGSAAAMAADWEVVTSGSTGSIISLDKNSIARTGSGRRKAWFKSTYTKPQVLSDEKTKYFETLELDSFDCSEHTMGMVQVIYRDAAGKVVYTYENPLTSPRHSDVAPETVGEAMLDAVCSATLPAAN